MEERITNKDFYPEIEECVNCKYYGEPNGCNCPDGPCDNYETFIEVYNKLRDIENGLEDGTIVKLPCKIGDKFYLIYKYPPEIIEKEVCGFTIEDNEITLIDENDSRYNQKLAHYCDEYLVYSREEAEKKLKELNK